MCRDSMWGHLDPHMPLQSLLQTSIPALTPPGEADIQAMLIANSCGGLVLIWLLPVPEWK